MAQGLLGGLITAWAHVERSCPVVWLPHRWGGLEHRLLRRVGRGWCLGGRGGLRRRRGGDRMCRQWLLLDRDGCEGAVGALRAEDEIARAAKITEPVLPEHRSVSAKGLL